MKTVSDRFSTAEETNVVADLFRAIVRVIWGFVRVPAYSADVGQAFRVMPATYSGAWRPGETG